MTRWTLTGTQDGAFGQISATGRAVSVEGITIYRFHKGKIAEGWMNWDALGMLQQLGQMRAEPDESVRRECELQGGSGEAARAGS